MLRASAAKAEDVDQPTVSWGKSVICRSLDKFPPPPDGRMGWPWNSTPDMAVANAFDDGELPTIGLVTPTYNSERYLEETIRSVLLQSYPKLEYYIVDGGSNDKTLDVIRKYEPWLTGWISEPDKGQADAINKGWQHCEGAWLGWMNGDDSYLPSALWVLARGIEECCDCEIVAGGAIWIDGSGSIIHRQTLSEFEYSDFLLSLGNHLPSGSTLIRRSVVQAVGGLDVSMNMICDTDYWMRAGLNAKVHTIPQEISTFRLHTGSKTLKLEATKADELIRAYDKLFTREDLPAAVRRLRRRAYSFCYLEAARYAVRSGDKRLAWSYLWASVCAGWKHIGPGHLFVAIQNVLGGRASRIARWVLRRGRAHRWGPREFGE
jgi:glycosyltransferase involved in cell wall biosynthesis